MRGGKADLEDVAARFETWRANKRGRLIPAELWRATLGLLNRYSPNAVCRRLRLDPTRLKQVRRGGIAGSAGGTRPCRKGSERREARRAEVKPRPARLAMVPAGRAFVEFPALGVALGEATETGSMRDGPPVGYRLVVESATGTLILLTRAPGGDLVEAMCRFVLGAMGGGVRP